MPTPLVVDISHYQTVTSFAALAAAGINGVIHKCTEGASYIDPTYAERRKEAEDVGLLWGAYHFLRPGDMLAQADFFMRTALPDANTLIVADHEDAGVSLDDLKTFLGALDGPHNQPVLYSGGLIKDQLGTRRDAELANYRLWLAQYGVSNPTWPTETWPVWWLWQYSDAGSLDGISGVVDLDCYEDDPDILAEDWAMPFEIPPASRVTETATITIEVPAGATVRVTTSGPITVIPI